MDHFSSVFPFQVYFTSLYFAISEKLFNGETRLDVKGRCFRGDLFSFATAAVFEEGISLVGNDKKGINRITGGEDMVIVSGRDDNWKKECSMVVIISGYNWHFCGNEFERTR